MALEFFVMIFYSYFICVFLNTSYLQATIYIKAPRSVSNNQLQNLVLKFMNPLRGIRRLTNSKVEVEIPLGPKYQRIARPLTSQHENENNEEKESENLTDRIGENRRVNVHNKINKTASTSTSVETAGIGSSNAASDPYNDIVRMKHLRTELLSLEKRLATGDRLAHDDDLKNALQELEKKHVKNGKCNGKGICNEESLLEEAMQPALLEDLWKILGHKFHNVTDLGCSIHKKENQHKINKNTTSKSKKSCKNKRKKEGTSSEVNNSDNKSKEDINSDSEIINRKNDNDGSNQYIEELRERIKLLKLGSVDQVAPHKNKDLDWMKLKIPSAIKDILIENS